MRAIGILLFLTMASCALKGGKGDSESRLEANSCTKAGFTCGHDGSSPSSIQPPPGSRPPQDATGYRAPKQYKPVCQLKDGSCECQCAATP